MNVRIPIALLVILAPLAADEVLRVGVTSASEEGFRTEAATSLPSNTCLTLSLLFEGQLVTGSQVAIYVRTDGTASKTLGPFPGRTLLRGVYVVRAEVDPENQDASVQGYYRQNPGAVEARGQVQLGTSEEAAQDRSACGEYLGRLVADCRQKQQEARVAYDDLVAGRRFQKAGARVGLDAPAWDQAIQALLKWQDEKNAAHQQFLDRVVGPYYPDLVRYTAFNFLGGLGLLFREYATKGYGHYKMKAPSQYAVKALIKPDLATMEMMFERDARSLLQGIGAQPMRNLSEVSIAAEHVPGGLRLTPVPEPLAKAVSANPATLTVEEMKKVEDWSAVAPGLDLVGAKEVFWLRMETPAEPKAEAEVWIVAYENAAQRAAAVVKLVESIPKDSLNRAFGGEQFLCWVRITGPMDEETYARVTDLCHKRVGW